MSWKSQKQIWNELLEENSSLKKQLKQYSNFFGRYKPLFTSVNSNPYLLTKLLEYK